MISRRFFMQTSAGLMASTALGSLWGTPARAFQIPMYDTSLLEGVSNKLPIPPIMEAAREVDGVTEFDITCQWGEVEILPGLKTQTMGMNAPYLAPLLPLVKGKKYRFNFYNDLPETTAIHWHGMHVPVEYDGGVHQAFDPGESWHPEFEVKNNEGVYLYHTHHMHRTAEEAYYGLAGGVVVFDPEMADLQIPRTLGVDDFPVIVQDKSFHADGSLQYDLDIPTMLLGHRGDVLVVNGVVNPYIEATTTLVKLRLVPVAGARYWNFKFEDGRPFYQLTTDGGYIEKPVKLTEIPMTPAERAEIVVEVKPGETLNLISVPWEQNHEFIRDLAAEMSTPERTYLDDSQTWKILEIRAAETLEQSPPLPEVLVGKLVMPDEKDAVREREFLIEMDMMDMNENPSDVRTARFSQALKINGKTFDKDRIDEYVMVGDTEIWSWTNGSAMPHNLHIHDLQFKILDRNGEPPEPYEMGLKDTFNMDPGDTVRIVCKFQDYVHDTLPYMYHCHILEHEDQGMMGQFAVVGDPNSAEA